MADLVVPLDGRDDDGEISVGQPLHGHGHVGERTRNPVIDVEGHDNAKTEREQDGAYHQRAGETVPNIRSSAGVFGAVQFAGDDRIIHLLNFGELLDGDAEDGVLCVVESLLLEVGNRRFDGRSDQRLAQSGIFPEQFPVFVARDVAGILLNQAVDFDQIAFNTVGVFLDVLGAGSRDHRDRQLLDADMHQIIDPGELAGRYEAFPV